MSINLPVIAGYTTVRALGRGQFGDVVLVQRTRDARVFAAKVPHAIGENSLQEAQLMQTLQHPNIIHCEEIVREDSGFREVIVMEYAAMGDLEGYIQGFAKRNEVIPEEEIMRILIQIASALVYLDDQRVLHRDLKPKNVLLDGEGIVKLSDFGVSRCLKRTLDVATTITGTPQYMSPELIDNQPYDGKTDVWSLGCIIFEVATLAPPFAAKALAPLVMQIVSNEPPQIPTIYSRELDSLIRKMLVKDPAKRLHIQEILAQPFVQKHLLRLASTVSVHPVRSKSHDLCQETKHPFQEPNPCRHQAQVVSCPLPSVDVQSACPVLPLDAPSRHAEEIDLRRKMFFENQAAAHRNKNRIAHENAASSIFLYDASHTNANDASQNGYTPINTKQKENMEAVKEKTKQFYLENARAARLNKQRALEAMKGQAEALLSTAPDPVGVAEVIPLPPAPPVRDNKSFETLLEEERRRVRAERKLLHERIRGHQLSMHFSVYRHTNGLKDEN